jgi:hypothetical protein
MESQTIELLTGGFVDKGLRINSAITAGEVSGDEQQLSVQLSQLALLLGGVTKKTAHTQDEEEQ